jgi:hypothetical protein
LSDSSRLPGGSPVSASVVVVPLEVVVVGASLVPVVVPLVVELPVELVGHHRRATRRAAQQQGGADLSQHW